MRLGHRIVLSLLGAALLVRCGGDTPTAPPGSAVGLRILSGNNQMAPAGTVLPESLRVQVYRGDGTGVPGVVVRFLPNARSGRLSAGSVTTDTAGVAGVQWTLGAVAGQARVSALVTGLPSVTFEATGLLAGLPLLKIIGGDGQQGEVGHALPERLVVQLADTMGGPLIGQPILWTIPTGDGLLRSEWTRTDTQGQASAEWLLGYTLGAQSVRASFNGTASFVTFSASGVFTEGHLTLVAGDSQINGAGLALPLPLTVAVETPNNNRVARVPVNWVVTSGGGTLSAPSTPTDQDGLASARWTLGPGGGTQTVSVSVPGITAPELSLHATSVVPIAGAIVGAVTVAGGFFSPAVSGSAGGPAMAGPILPSGDFRPTPISPAAGAAAMGGTDRLIVSLRAAAVGAPPSGMALAGPAQASTVGAAMKQLLMSRVTAADFEVTDVSPVILRARVRVRQSADLDAVAARLASDPAVAGVARERWLYPHGRAVGPAAADAVPGVAGNVPGDPLYPNQSWHYAMLDLPQAWSITTGSAGVLVAVVDNGIRFDHPALAANLTRDGYDFVSSAPVLFCNGQTQDNAGDGDGYDADPSVPSDYDFDPFRGCLSSPTKVGGHGIHTAGTIGAVGNDGIGVTGVNWRVRIRPVRVIGLLGGSDFDVAQGVLYAAGLPASNGLGGIVPPPSGGPARVINLSLGGTCLLPGQPDVLHDATIAATGAGALVIASAGNDASSEPACPASYPEVISVAAVGPDGSPATYSNFGPTIDLAAPGGDFSSGDGTFGVFSTTCDFTVTPCLPNYARYAGTSMAAPHVTGVAALLLAANPGLSVAELRARLLQYAVDAGAPGPDSRYGAGIVNARNSLTQTLAPPGQVQAVLYDSATGARVGTQAVDAGGNFTFSSLPDGTYFVFAGKDENDGLVGVPGRPWGGYGGSGTPVPIRVSATTGGTAFFRIGFPGETEPNDDPASSNRLIVGGYVEGAINPALDPRDVYRVQIAQSGTYTFETSGWNGASCDFALELNTVLTVQDAGGTTLASNDDIDPRDPTPLVGNRCSRVSLPLTPGTYYVTVLPGSSLSGGIHSGRYRLEARGP